MESKRLRLTPGMARVEFLAVKDTFRRYARKYFPGGKNEQAGKLKRTDTRSKHSPGAELPPSPAAPAKSPRTTSDGPRMIVPQNKSFQDSSVPDVADLLQVSKEEE